MGYRSCGKMFIPKELEQELTEAMVADLENWEIEEESEEGTVYAFWDWKWYEGYDDVDMWNTFYYDNYERGVDLIVCGEDSAIIVEPQFEKFGYSMDIQVY